LTIATPTFAELKNVAVFRAGDYGEKGVYTVDDLKGAASAYNSGNHGHEAPLTVNHDDVAAYGWAEQGSATVKGDTLFLDFKQVPDEFVSLVKDGRLKKRSIEFYMDQTPDKKPAPGKKFIRAVTLLGAQPPEVKGMPDIKFGEADKDIERVSIDFAETDATEDSELKTLIVKEFSDIKKLFAEKKDVTNCGEGTMTPEQIAAMQKENAEMKERIKKYEESATAEKGKELETLKADMAKMSEAKTAAEKRATEAEAKATAAETKATAAEAKFAEVEKASRKEKLDAAVKAAKDKGQPPAVINPLVGFAESQISVPATVIVTFKEDGKDVTMPAFDAALKPLLALGATTLTKQTVKPDAKFEEERAKGADENKAQLDREEKISKFAEEYQKQHPGTDRVTASIKAIQHLDQEGK
jgi:hypothetical protein